MFVSQVFTDLGDLSSSTLKIGTSLKFDCSNDPDVKQAADLLMELRPKLGIIFIIRPPDLE